MDLRLARVGSQGACGGGSDGGAEVALESAQQGRHGPGIVSGAYADVRDRARPYALVGVADIGEQVVARAGAPRRPGTRAETGAGCAAGGRAWLGARRTAAR